MEDTNKVRKVRLINLTNHDINFIQRSFKDQKPNHNICLTVAPYGILARIHFTNDFLENIEYNNVKMPILRTAYTTVKGLLEEKEGVLYIVPKPVADRVGKEREDLVFLSGLVRDSKGAILGGTHLSRPSI